MSRLLLACLALLPLAACSPGPDYVRPQVDVGSAFREAGRWQSTDGQAEAVNPTWWKVFADPALDELEAQVEVGNQNLKAAEAQYRVALAAVQTARSSFFPTVTGSVSSTRGSAATGTVGGPAPVGTTDALTLSASWEIDVWGRIRRNVESARAGEEASAADLAAARLSAQALLAQTYVQLRATDVQIDLYRRTVEAYTRFLELTRNRLAAGVASPLDVAQAETQLGTAQTQAADLENQRAQLDHAIATLVGKLSAEHSVPPAARLPTLPPTPALVPSTVLVTRPDIAGAERRVAAANARIGVAEAAWFPVLDLTGSAGYRGASFGGLLTAPHRFWSLGPALALTLLDGGARSAAVSSATASYDQAVAEYRQAVLTAFQEVEDNLAAARLLDVEAQAQARALAAASRSREIAENQYKAGVINALNVVTAQTAELSATANSVSIASRRLQAAVQLFKNTGGAPAPR